ncbi:MAG TPA: T9SS type A sorting domain-containing protein, partial [Saprospiraceae bacterium]|nr:T9SS type A sorting domain-containing protein [Saprospiraceae bacterium]
MLEHIDQHTTGILQTVQPKELNVDIFPNPTSGNFSVYVDKTKSESVRIELFDMMGKKLLSEFAFENSIEIPMKLYPDGLYLIKVISRGRQVIRKILKVGS